MLFYRIVGEVHKRFELAKSLRIDRKPTSGRSLLEQLLDQSDQYTGYMLARSLASQNNTSSIEKDKSTRGPKRAQRRRDHEEELLLREADEELAGHQGFWTRLSQQPSTITGGTMKPYQLEVRCVCVLSMLYV